MVEFLWIDCIALAAGASLAALDVDFQVGRHAAGRPVYGVLVLLGLLGAYAEVVGGGALPAPGFGILFFAVLYLPFLSQSFIDLDVTDRIARRELERLLLGKDYRELRNASGQDVVREGKRRLRLHWEARSEGGHLVVELDVHPSLSPVTVSRPHVATIRDQAHLERIREDIRRRRERAD
ncbi:MAG: hypothetical protein ACT4PE_02520 [Candidatus Eiseniibacteriota bacterium]